MSRNSFKFNRCDAPSPFMSMIVMIVTLLSFTSQASSEQVETKADELWKLTLSTGEVLVISEWQIGEKTLLVETSSGRKTLEISEVAMLTAFTPPPKIEPSNLEVGLSDGSLLFAVQMTSLDRDAKLELPGEISLNLRRSDLLWFWRVSEKKIVRPRDAWEKLLSEPPANTDALAVNRDGTWRWIEGTVGGIGESSIEFTVGDKSAEIKRDRIEGVYFMRNSSLSALDMIANVTLTNESNVKAAKLTSNGKQLHIETLHSAVLDIPMSLVAKIDFSTNQFVWLSDLSPTTIDWKPLLAGQAVIENLRQLHLPCFDASITGAPLTLNLYPDPTVESVFETKTFQKGVAMRGGARLAYALDGKYRSLSGLVGFAPAARGGSVRLRIEGDGKSIFDKPLSTEVDRAPINLDIDVKGVQRIVIEVDYQDGRSVGDLLHLCEIKVTK